MSKHKKRVKFKRRDIARFLQYLRECMKWVVVLDEEGRPTPPSFKPGELRVRRESDVKDRDDGTFDVTHNFVMTPKDVMFIPPAVLRAITVADEFLSGINANVDRLREAVSTALSVIGSPSLSKEHRVVGDLASTLAKAHAHDLGFDAGLEEDGKDIPPEVTPNFADDFRKGYEEGLAKRKEMLGDDVPSENGDEGVESLLDDLKGRMG